MKAHKFSNLYIELKQNIYLQIFSLVVVMYGMTNKL